MPANYASKSKLVQGDILKLTIADDGAFLYKQIGPIARKQVVGALKLEGGPLLCHRRQQRFPRIAGFRYILQSQAGRPSQRLTSPKTTPRPNGPLSKPLSRVCRGR
ncbi:MAG: hypothetical protein WDN27_03050 [Candidatus Saccharibacteria bacterium]